MLDIAEGYWAATGRDDLDVVTSKPLKRGGLEGRHEATGRGVAYAIQEVYQRQERELKGSTVVIQAFGAVGSEAARKLHELGCRIVAVSEADGYIYDPNGIDIPALYKWMNKDNEPGREARPFMEFPGGQKFPRAHYRGREDDVLTVKCNIL